MFLAGNLPPGGRGVYARSQSVDWLATFDFVCLVATRGDTRTKARQLVARGRPVWLYDMPSEWTPSHDIAAVVARFEALARDVGATGCIADLEAGWPQADIEPARAALAASVARGFRWGVTSYPELRERLRPLSALDVWFSPQMYNQSGATAAAYQKWLDVFGARRVIPSIALWRGAPGLGTDDHFKAYFAGLGSLASARGAIAWTTDATDEVADASIVAMFRDYAPWHDVVTRALLWLAAYIPTPVGIATIVALVVAAVVAVILLR